LKFTADYFRSLIQTIEKQYPHPFMPVYVFSNLDKNRSMVRLGGDVRKAKLLHMLQMTVRGVPCLYYGEEIGMTNARLPFATARDPIAHKYTFLPRLVFDAFGILVNRDEVRTPMQWDGTKNAGFSSADQTWLPVHENYKQVNVEREQNDDHSLLTTVHSLLEIHTQEPAIAQGSLTLMDSLPKGVLGYTRSVDGDEVCILLNFESEEKVFPTDYPNCMFELIPGSRLDGTTARLEAFGGLILKRQA
jgi:glycosidase